MSFFKYKMQILYDGTNYCGWQVQPNGMTIQQLIQESLKQIFGKEIGIVGSGRTDAGVHAWGQVAHFTYEKKLDPFKLQGALNGILPKDVRITAIEEVDPGFHARYSAIGKTYHYNICLGTVQDPFKRYYSVHIRENINLEMLHAAAKYFIGTHDFTSFTNQAYRGTAAHDPIRTIRRLEIVAVDRGFRLEFEGDGFLYKMVRNIVGMLIDIASGKKRIEELPDIFSAKDRRFAGRSMPPHGLVLVKVDYPDSFAKDGKLNHL